MIIKLKNNSSGTTTLEYGLMGAGIAIFVAVGVATVGDQLVWFPVSF